MVLKNTDCCLFVHLVCFIDSLLCVFNDGQVSEDADISSCPVLLTSKVEDEEHSCSSLVTDQVLDPIKQVLENKSSSSAISRENTGGSTLRPLLLMLIVSAGPTIRWHEYASLISPISTPIAENDVCSS